jgi:hypothetical protein
MGAGGFSPRIKWQGHEVNHSPPSGFEVKDGTVLLPRTELHGEVLSKLSTDFFNPTLDGLCKYNRSLEETEQSHVYYELSGLSNRNCRMKVPQISYLIQSVLYWKFPSIFFFFKFYFMLVRQLKQR